MKQNNGVQLELFPEYYTFDINEDLINSDQPERRRELFAEEYNDLLQLLNKESRDDLDILDR